MCHWTVAHSPSISLTTTLVSLNWLVKAAKRASPQKLYEYHLHFGSVSGPASVSLVLQMCEVSSFRNFQQGLSRCSHYFCEGGEWLWAGLEGVAVLAEALRDAVVL
jgi:hypothetical protein